MTVTYTIMVMSWILLIGSPILMYFKGDKPWISWVVMGIGEILAFTAIIRLNC